MPTPRQALFLSPLLNAKRKALYGGSAGGGKSSALLMGALQYVDQPEYAALILRRTYADLALPGALMDRANEWLRPTDAHWSEVDKTWTFPSGATLTFGYLQHATDMYRYQSAEFHYIAFDELTQFEERQYRYMFSRLRRAQHSRIPIRMRAASNPGGLGHEWVKRRFIDTDHPHRAYVPAKLEDNPHVDRDEYVAALAELDPVTRAQLLSGSWDAKEPGRYFQRHWFEIVGEAPAGIRRVRYWDLAATEPDHRNPDPDWTRGCLMGERNGVYFILDMRGIRARPRAVEELVKQTAALDGRGVPVWIEREPGASGKGTVEHYRDNVLRGYMVEGDSVGTNKLTRALPLSSSAEARNVKLVRGPWNADFLDEIESFPDGPHDDQVDAAAGARNALAAARDRIIVTG